MTEHSFNRQELRILCAGTGTTRFGLKCLRVLFEVVGPHDSPLLGTAIHRSYAINREAAPFLRRFLDACGYGKHDYQRHGLYTELLAGCAIAAHVSLRTYAPQPGAKHPPITYYWIDDEERPGKRAAA